MEKQNNKKKKIIKEFSKIKARNLFPSQTVRFSFRGRKWLSWAEKMTPREYAAWFYHFDTDAESRRRSLGIILKWSDDEETNKEIIEFLDHEKKCLDALSKPSKNFVYKLEAFYKNDATGDNRAWLDNSVWLFADFQAAFDFGKKLNADNFLNFTIGKIRLITGNSSTPKTSENTENLFNVEDMTDFLGEASFKFDGARKCVLDKIYYEEIDEKKRFNEANTFADAFVDVPYPFKKGDQVKIRKGRNAILPPSPKLELGNYHGWEILEDKSIWQQKIQKAKKTGTASWSDLNVKVTWGETEKEREEHTELVNFLFLEKPEFLGKCDII